MLSIGTNFSDREWPWAA